MYINLVIKYSIYYARRYLITVIESLSKYSAMYNFKRTFRKQPKEQDNIYSHRYVLAEKQPQYIYSWTAFTLPVTH